MSHHRSCAITRGRMLRSAKLLSEGTSGCAINTNNHEASACAILPMTSLVRTKRKENHPERAHRCIASTVGRRTPTDATFCPKCGKPLPTIDQDEPTVSTIPPALSSPYGRTPYMTTPSSLSDTGYTLPPPSGVPSSGERQTPLNSHLLSQLNGHRTSVVLHRLGSACASWARCSGNLCLSESLEA